jgi:hypothetical protein
MAERVLKNIVSFESGYYDALSEDAIGEVFADI